MIPSVITSTLIGYYFMFWVEKYALFYRSKRPSQNCRALTATAQTLMLLGPLILGLGGIIWVCTYLNDYSSLIFIAYMVLIGFGILYFITPF